MSLEKSAETSSSQTTQAKCDGYDEEQKVENADIGSEDAKQIISRPTTSILYLPDEVLLDIMKFLDPRDIINLGWTCQRLHSVVRDKTLWNEVDLTAQAMMLCQLSEFMGYFHHETMSIATNGTVTNGHFRSLNRKDQWCVPKKMFQQLNETCPALETFIANYHCFDGGRVLISDFPATLKKLVLKGCDVNYRLYQTMFFFGIENHMVNLQELILDECQWVMANSLLPISECLNLRKLSLRHCRNLRKGYSLLSFFQPFSDGFESLEVLDVRGSSLGDLEIACFQTINSLTHLYLEEPESSLPPIPINNDQSGTESTSESRLRHLCGPLTFGARCVCCAGKIPEEDLELQMHDTLDFHTSESASDVEYNCVKFDYRLTSLGMNAYSHTPFVESNWAEQIDPKPLITDEAILALLSEDDNDDEDDDDDDDDTLSHSTTGPNISDLMILNCKGVTDRSLIHLVNFTTLKNLNVCGTSVTPKGIHRFLLNRPDVNVVSDYSETDE